jgi:hypothetical protein
VPWRQGYFAKTDTWRYLRFLSDGHEELLDRSRPYEQVDLAASS